MNSRYILAPEYFMRYINLSKDDAVLEALKKNTHDFLLFLNNIPQTKTDYAYAEGKWTIKQMLQHIIDAERVFAYRSLWFARNAGSALPGFDENIFADHAQVANRVWEEMIEEFALLRRTTEILFGNFTEEQLQRNGVADNNIVNVAGIGYICSGHVAHHINILKERYGL